MFICSVDSYIYVGTPSGWFLCSLDMTLFFSFVSSWLLFILQVFWFVFYCLCSRLRISHFSKELLFFLFEEWCLEPKICLFDWGIVASRSSWRTEVGYMCMYTNPHINTCSVICGIYKMYAWVNIDVFDSNNYFLWILNIAHEKLYSLDEVVTFQKLYKAFCFLSIRTQSTHSEFLYAPCSTFMAIFSHVFSEYSPYHYVEWAFSRSCYYWT
jgi:hypothetical protein